MWSTLFKKRATAKKRPVRVLYAQHKEEARRVITERVQFYAPICRVTYGRIAIRDTRRSWGSCSSHGNLNFSYKLLFLPPCLRDYIVVHELCHRHELNHGTQFWNHVAAILPDYTQRMETLRSIERQQGTSVPTLQKISKVRVCYCHLR